MVVMLCMQVVQRRVDLMVSEGIEFQTGVTIGKDIAAKQLLDDFDAVVLCLGSTWPRDLSIPGQPLPSPFFPLFPSPTAFRLFHVFLLIAALE